MSSSTASPFVVCAAEWNTRSIKNLLGSMSKINGLCSVSGTVGDLARTIKFKDNIE